MLTVTTRGEAKVERRPAMVDMTKPIYKKGLELNKIYEAKIVSAKADYNKFHKFTLTLNLEADGVKYAIDSNIDSVKAEAYTASVILEQLGYKDGQFDYIKEINKSKGKTIKFFVETMKFDKITDDEDGDEIVETIKARSVEYSLQKIEAKSKALAKKAQRAAAKNAKK